MVRIRLVLVLGVAVVASQAAPAGFSQRTMSIEWWTNVSDAVYIAEVSRAKEIKPENQFFNVQELDCKITATLKGEGRKSLGFQQFYRNDEKVRGTDTIAGDHKLQPKDRVVLFWAKPTAGRKAEVIFWVNLARPSPRYAHHAAYGNDCKRLGDAEAIVALVKARNAKENPKHRVKRRGLIINFTDYDDGDIWWTFVRTADPEYKKVLINQLRQKEGEVEFREDAIYNLVSYPGQETIDLLSPLLKDPTVQEHNLGDKKVTRFPIRQMAYIALDLLDAKPAKPDGYLEEDPFAALILARGFEHEAQVPWGDWKRFKDE
jgi:hypothetical protein